MSITEQQFDAAPRETVEVRRHGGLAALVGALAAAVAIAWLGRATDSGAALDWLVAGALAVVAAGWLVSFVDARTPLLVADDHGVRIRLGHAWQGLPWEALESVRHQPRQAWWRDGVLALEPVDAERLLEEADGGVRRRAWLNRRLHGAPLAVPLGLATRTVGAGDDLTVTLRRLAQGATPVLEATGAESVTESIDEPVVESVDEPVVESLTPQPVEVSESFDEPVEPEPSPASALALRARRRFAGLLARRGSSDEGAGVADLPASTAALPADTTDTADLPAPAPAGPEAAPVEPVRPLIQARRSEVHQRLQAEPDTASGRELRRDGRVSLVEEGIAAPESAPAMTPLAVDDTEEEVAPRPDPVIGPVLTRARERIGLSVDALAERTRIRPHVIEAIEVDDFAPCGGDFYARGHLRTLGRVLGLEAGPLVKLYDERYADAPINARKVFEAELASGAGGIRAVRGGPNWSVVVAAVMAVVLAWSVAKLAMDDDPEPEGVMSLSQGSGGPNGSAQEPERVTLKVTATAPTQVQVRSASGRVVFSQELAPGDIHRIDVVPPAKVRATDAGAVEVEIDNEPRGTVGKAGQPGSKKFTG